MNVYKRLAGYTLKHKFLLIFCLFFVMIYVASQIGGIQSAGTFFSNAFIGKNFEKVNLTSILVLLAFGLVYALSHYLIFLASNTLAVNVMHDIRRDIFRKMVDMPLFYYKKNKTGEILSRILNDIGVIEIFFMNIAVELFAQPLTLVSVVVFMFIINAKISIFFFAIAPVLAVVLGSLGAVVQKMSLGVQKNISDITSNIQEAVYGMEIIKGYGVEETIKNKFAAANDSHLQATRKEMKVRFLGTPSAEFLGVAGVLIILILGAVSVQKGVASAQEIVNFIFLAFILAQPLSRSTDIFMILRKLKPAADRVFEVIDSKEREHTLLPSIGEIEGNIEFRKLTFQYEDERTALSGISLKIKKGETVAIVGHSGAGKSTLISLIPVFYMPTKGEILIDDKNTILYNPLSLRKQISLVTQENILFSGSIQENIRLSRPEASEKEVREAARVANAETFISKLPEGYETVLGERGVRLSGGEKQRIALARAILRKPKILIMDEATSSLDAESEQLIQKAMKKILGQQTTIIVSHKLSTIMNADRIVVMENGKIVEIGTHQELLDERGIYQKLFQIQVDV